MKALAPLRSSLLDPPAAPRTDLPGRTIMAVAANHIGIPTERLKSARRHRPLVEARFMIMWLLQRHRDFSLPQIGHLLGGLDHTTVLNGIRVVKDRLRTDTAFASRCRALDACVQSYDCKPVPRPCEQDDPQVAAGPPSGSSGSETGPAVVVLAPTANVALWALAAKVEAYLAARARLETDLYTKWEGVARRDAEAAFLALGEAFKATRMGKPS